MSTETTTRDQNVTPKRLWFGFSAAAGCWVGLGIADTLITWRACLHYEQYGGASHHPGLLALNIVIFVGLLAIAIVAGVMSYSNWQRLSGDTPLSEAEAEGPREYFALLGIFTSLTLGFGIIWFGLPLLFLSLCSRVR